MDSTPASLLHRLQYTATPEAWQRFVNLYTPLLYFWACRLGLQSSDASDLVQEVFATLVQVLPRFSYDQHRSFRSWLRTVALNKWRDNRRRHATALRGANSAGLEEVAVPDHAEAIWEAEYQQHVTAQALEMMRADFQPVTWQAFWAVVVEGKTPAVVAEELGVSVNAVYMARSRVLRRLREELAGLLA